MTNVLFANAPWVKATCDVEIEISMNPETGKEEGFVIKDCQVREGKDGLYLAPPEKKLSKPYTDKNKKLRTYAPIVWVPYHKREELNELLANFYDPSKENNVAYTSDGVITPKKKETQDVDLPF
tara:strand:- start:3030 stop:3401 length:372 start_codon:yes stop_codon:yes gene_type:complete